MNRLAVVADDLTGALDATAPFAARGIVTAVALGPDGLAAALACGAQVVGVSTDSREVAPELARQAVADCVAQLPDGISIFKKVDSRLKGNIAAELDAIPFTRALVMPAIPDFGRWVKNGRLGGYGVPEPIAVEARLGRHFEQASVPDTSSQADIAQALDTTEHDLPVGARGLAEALAARMAPDFVAMPMSSISGPVIVVIGSTDPITLAQVDRLRSARADLVYVAAPGGEMAAPPMPASLTVVQATDSGAKADPLQVARQLARAVLLLRPRPGTTLVVSGGATAQTVLRGLGISVLQLLGEALPGLPIARAGGFTVITKSGGFGQPHTLLDLLGHSAGSDRESNG
jgi:uncharacterized protein YgbK (DUF1537 family)